MLSATIPAYQAEPTLQRVIAALRAQVSPPILVVDDGSTDATARIARDAGAQVISQRNAGRGAARATIMRETRAPLVLMCDTTMEPAFDFTARALPWFSEDRVAAVFGHVSQLPPKTVADRWRGRHLFKPVPPPAPVHGALLATTVCVLRRSAVEAVGGFDPRLRAGEDADLGRRLLAAGWDVVADPALRASSLTSDSPRAVLRRFARWNSPDGIGAYAFVRQFAYAVKVMARADLRARDPLAALLSIASPFYQLRRR